MADWNWGDAYAVDEDDDGETLNQQWTPSATKDGVIYLIDCSEKMFEENEEGSAFQMARKCVQSEIQSNIFSRDQDLFAIVFYATEEFQNANDFKHVYVFMELVNPGADQVLDIEKLENITQADFKKKYGHSNDYSLSDVFWACSDLFSSSQKKLGSKKILLFTNESDPHATNAQKKRQSTAKISDMHQNGISVELLQINPIGSVFDVTAFYQDALIIDEDSSPICDNVAEKFEDMLVKVRKKQHKKRASARVPFKFGQDIEMSVGIYNLVRASTVPAKVKLYKTTNEPVKTVTRSYVEETGELIMPSEMRKMQVYGGKVITFDPDEIKNMKDFDVAGIRLVGFKPRSALEPFHHVKPSVFLYPDETNIEGSTCMFSALLSRCLARDRIAICQYVPRRNTAPSFAALVPQAEVLDEYGVQKFAPGFHLIVLPYADDIRNLKFDEALKDPNPSEAQVGAAKDLLSKFDFPYSPERFDNPKLQKHYSTIEALALGRPEMEEPRDYTILNESKIEKKFAKEIKAFIGAVFPAGYDPSVKRKAPYSAVAAAKRAKLEENIDLATEAQNDRLAKLTVAVLRSCMAKANITASGSKKADLIDAINDFYGI